MHKAPAKKETFSSSKEEEDESQEDDAINTEECNEETIGNMLAPLSSEYYKKKWKSIYGIFDKWHIDLVVAESEVGIEDINVKNVEEKGVAPDGIKGMLTS